MKSEERDLLLKDLCARLPYNVRCLHKEDDDLYYVDTIVGFDGCRFEIEEQFYDVEEFKPYLRPMSSMTNEEYESIKKEFLFYGDSILHTSELFTCVEAVDWLNAHYFDYHDLVEKGLALEAPEGMYKI